MMPHMWIFGSNTKQTRREWSHTLGCLSADISEHTVTVMAFLQKPAEDIIPTKSISIFPNQRLWINNPVRAMDRRDEERKARSNLRRAVRSAERAEKAETESQRAEATSLTAR